MIPEELVADLKSHMLIDDATSDNIVFLSPEEKIPKGYDFACIVQNDKVVHIINLSCQHIDHEAPAETIKPAKFMLLKSGTTVNDAVTQFYRKKYSLALVTTTGDADQESIVGVVSSAHLIELIGDVSTTLR